MDCQDASDEERLEALQNAALAHVRVVKDALAAMGCDRHLFGLRKLMSDEESASSDAALFDDAVFTESGTWKMSTSHLVSDYFDGWGYGEVTPDGYGCSYTVKDHRIQFNVVSKGLQSDRLGDLLEQSLLDMQALCLRTGAKAAPRSRM